MFEKTSISKDHMVKGIAVILVASVFFLTMSVLTDDNDSRKQISDNDGASETALCNILSQIDGVGEVSVLVEYEDDSTVCGVIVTAQGAHDPIVKHNIVKGVSTLYGIPVSNVMVFQKSQEVIK